MLFLAEQPLAAVYVLARESSHLYLSGYDPGLTGVSLGSLVIHHAVCCAIERQRECVDFLRGQEAYKYAWGAHDKTTYRLCGAPRAQAARGSTGSASPSSCWRTSSA